MASSISTLNGVLSKAEFGSLNFVVDVDIGIASALVWDYLLRRVGVVWDL